VGARPLADVEDLDALGVAEVGTEPSLVQEHVDELLVLGKLRQNTLDGDLLAKAFDARAFAQVHLGHSPRCDEVLYLIALGFSHAS
jgi:hypothetical protein